MIITSLVLTTTMCSALIPLNNEERSVKNDQWKFQKSFFPQYEQCKDAKGFREPEGCQIIQMKG